MAQQIKITKTSNADMNIGIPKQIAMAQQTAVEWFEQNISKYIHYQYEQAYEQHKEVTEIFEQAKQMEKEQIIQAHCHNRCLNDKTYECSIKAFENSEQYYNETYGEKGI